MKITIPAFCIATLIVLAPDRAAQKSQARKTGSRTPVEMPARPASGDCGHVACAEGVLAQGTDRCIKASSTPTFGLLFPYPGLNNTFVPPAFVGGGENNQATSPRSTVGGGYNNSASGYYATVGGGRFNTAYGNGSAVGGGMGNNATGTHAAIGGGGSNTASGAFSTVAGGRFNTASASGLRYLGYATVGGGSGNTSSQNFATVAGGLTNTASGNVATVGGGYYNTADGNGTAVGGGSYNTASGDYATVGGGYSNTASGHFSTAAGGGSNTALGDFSFAAGSRAMANHDGAFVWGDTGLQFKSSSAPNEFNVYASGGVRMFTNSAATTGAALAPGSGTWSMLSDRDSKENVEPVDAQAVLEAVAVMTLSTWNYKEQDDSIRHMGPMAQDFHAAFGLGISDKLIDTVDPDGVALAAIQGLNAKLQSEMAELRTEKDAEIAELRAELSAVRDQIGALVAASSEAR